MVLTVAYKSRDVSMLVGVNSDDDCVVLSRTVSAGIRRNNAQLAAVRPIRNSDSCVFATSCRHGSPSSVSLTVPRDVSP